MHMATHLFLKAQLHVTVETYKRNCTFGCHKLDSPTMLTVMFIVPNGDRYAQRQDRQHFVRQSNRTQASARRGYFRDQEA